MIPFIAIAAVLAITAIVLTVNGSRRSGGVKHQLREHDRETAQRAAEPGDSSEEAP